MGNGGAVEAAAARRPLRRLRAPGGFCSPCGGRGLAVEIRYANELRCIELVLLRIEGTNTMHPNPNICIPYACTDQPTVRAHLTESVSRQKLMRSESQPSHSQFSLESGACSISARSLQEKTYKSGRELRFTFGSDFILVFIPFESFKRVAKS